MILKNGLLSKLICSYGPRCYQPVATEKRRGLGPPALRSLLRSRRGHRSGDLGARVLVNCADSTRLGRDVRALLSAQPELALLEHAIHRDTSVPEALALQRPIIVASPTSQAAEDFERVALWTLDELDAGRDARPPQASRGEPITVADVSSANGASR